MEILVTPSAVQKGIKNFHKNPVLLASIPLLVGGFPHYDQTMVQSNITNGVYFKACCLVWPLPGLHDKISITSYFQDIVLEVRGSNKDKYFKRSITIEYEDLNKWLDIKNYFRSAYKYARTGDIKDLYKETEWA